MISIARAAYTTFTLYLMRRREFDNQKLRSFFRERYGIDIGLYSYGCFDRWRMPGPLRIGRYCSIAKTVRSTNNNHPIDALTTHPALYERKFGVIDTDARFHGHLTIGDDVWIGHYAVILPGCRGDRAWGNRRCRSDRDEERRTLHRRGRQSCSQASGSIHTGPGGRDRGHAVVGPRHRRPARFS